MPRRIGIAQTKHPQDGDVIGLVRRTCKQASEAGAELVVFPESLMSRFEQDTLSFTREAESSDGPFAQALGMIAREFGLWIIFTMNERGENALPYNTAVIVDAGGTQRGRYRKVHLFDSSTVTESAKMSAGDAVFEPIDSPFGRIGLGICYDLRFPELARRQALEGCELLLYPAAWVDGPGKEIQWETLLRARAIENEVFVAGICRADEGYVGRSYVFAPDGTLIASTRPHAEELLIADIDLNAIASMRAAIPVFDHRRPELY